MLRNNLEEVNCSIFWITIGSLSTESTVWFPTSLGNCSGILTGKQSSLRTPCTKQNTKI